MYGYIYKHTSPSGKSYIGQTIRSNPELRWKKDGSGYGSQRVFGKAIKKYGWENFKHEIIWEGETDQKFLNQLEEDLIVNQNTLHPNGYNLISSGSNSCCSAETRALISYRTKQGMTETVCKRLSDIRKGKPNFKNRGKVSPMKGKHHTNESRAKMSFFRLGNKLSLETRNKMSESRKVLRWFTDGVTNVRKKECPPGFTAGRTVFIKEV